MKQRGILFAFLALLLALIAFVLFLSRMESGFDLNRAVRDAINQPGGGDYAAAVAAVRRSDETPDSQAFEVGRLVIGSYDRPGARRPAETLQQGLHLMEQAASSDGAVRGPARQQLRLLFERGIGTPPNEIPVNATVADCWRALENNALGDAARCVRLRQQLLPGLR